MSSFSVLVVINKITGYISSYTYWEWNYRFTDCQYSWCCSSNLSVSCFLLFLREPYHKADAFQQWLIWSVCSQHRPQVLIDVFSGFCPTVIEAAHATSVFHVACLCWFFSFIVSYGHHMDFDFLWGRGCCLFLETVTLCCPGRPRAPGCTVSSLCSLDSRYTLLAFTKEFCVPSILPVLQWLLSISYHELLS